MKEKTYLLELTHSSTRRTIDAVKMIVQNDTYLFFDESGELKAAYPCATTIIVSVRLSQKENIKQFANLLAKHLHQKVYNEEKP